jgi:hypothetical protein
VKLRAVNPQPIDQKMQWWQIHGYIGLLNNKCEERRDRGDGFFEVNAEQAGARLFPVRFNTAYNGLYTTHFKKSEY